MGIRLACLHLTLSNSIGRGQGRAYSENGDRFGNITITICYRLASLYVTVSLVSVTCVSASNGHVRTLQSLKSAQSLVHTL